MLYITDFGEKHYLSFGASGVLHLVSEEDKNDIVSNGMSMHQQLNELLFDIVVVKASDVTLPSSSATNSNESSGTEQLNP